jgi:hypothetical protein
MLKTESHSGINIVKISLKRVEMNFCPGSKNSIIGKTQRKLEDKQSSSRVEKYMLKQALISL